MLKEKLLGIIVLGDKLSENAYTKQDLDSLMKLSNLAAVAFNNALSYDKIEERKADLERFYNLTVGKELKMVELKKEIKKLKNKK